MQPPEKPNFALAKRLRSLREVHWPELRITQQQLAQAFGADRPLSLSLISSWESSRIPVAPPPQRLRAYATFFATRRSVGNQRARLLSDDELTEPERTFRDRLLEELLHLREHQGDGEPEPAVSIPLAAPGDTIGGGTWYFPDQKPVTIICARLPPKLRQAMPYADPDDPDYVRAHTYADLDSLIEVFGHIRAINPAIEVNIRAVDSLEEDDYSAHLVLLGGVDWNPVTADILRRLKVPVRQLSRLTDEGETACFEADDDGERRTFSPVLERVGDAVFLREDVAHFFRGINPYNTRRTITLCNGMYGRGTYGAVRALTDARFRDRNEEYLGTRFGGLQTFGILTRVSIAPFGDTLTPDWSIPDNRLHEWPSGGGSG